MSGERTIINAEDTERITFLQRLDYCIRENCWLGDGTPPVIDEFEKLLMNSFLSEPRGMDKAQRDAIDALRAKCEGKL